MRPVLLLTLYLTVTIASAQEKPLALPGELPGQQLDIGPYTSFYEDHSGDTLPLATIRQQRFRPFAQKRNERSTFAAESVIVTWLRFTIHNTHPTDTLRLLHSTSEHGLITLYESGQVIGQTGISLPPQRRASRFALPFAIPPTVTQTYYVRVIDHIWCPAAIDSNLLSVKGSYELDYVWQLNSDILLAVTALLAGCLFFISLYTFYSFLLTRDKALLYYALYALICFLFTLHHMDYRFSFAMLFPLRMSETNSPFHIALIAIFYTLFITELIEVRVKLPNIWRVLQLLLAVMAAQEICSIIEFILKKPIFVNNTIYIYAMVPAGLSTCVLISAVFRIYSPIRPYLLAGMFSLLVISFIPGTLDLYFPNLPAVAYNFINDPFLWVILGLTIEACCFSLALAYRGRLIELEKNQIQQRYSQDLESQLEQRSREIEQQTQLLESLHIRQLRGEFERKLADTEMTALRAQMNPHFIFNCLNSIKLYTLQNNPDKACDYLTKFSRLIRLVLENSRSDLVTLQNELEALQLYIELEAMRFKEKVDFTIHVAPEIDQQNLCIPPLLLQPYAENAIWHGLMHKPEGGMLSVEVSQPRDNLLHIEITDDGVGRQRAAELKSKSAGKHKSFGMQVTADRIRMINQLYNTQTQARIIDLVAPDGESLGTKVVLAIPV